LKEKLISLNDRIGELKKLTLADRVAIRQAKRMKMACCCSQIPWVQNNWSISRVEGVSVTRLSTDISSFSALWLRPSDTATKKHKLVFEAVVVIVQYQMDNGSPIFAT
jgi:hypothetical protein